LKHGGHATLDEGQVTCLLPRGSSSQLNTSVEARLRKRMEMSMTQTSGGTSERIHKIITISKQSRSIRIHSQRHTPV